MSNDIPTTPANLTSLFSSHNRASDRGAYLRVTTAENGELQTREESKSARIAKSVGTLGIYSVVQERKFARLVAQVAERDLQTRGPNQELRYGLGLTVGDRSVATVSAFIEAIRGKTAYVNLKSSVTAAKSIAATPNHAAGSAALHYLVVDNPNSTATANSISAWVDNASSPTDRSARQHVRQQFESRLEDYISSGPTSERDARREVAAYLSANFQNHSVDLNALAGGRAAYDQGGGIDISELPAVFHYFPNLVELNLTAKSGLLNIDNLHAPKLTTLRVTNSFIQALPKALDRQFPLLNELDVGNNLLAGIPSDQRWPPHLAVLDLQGNAVFADFRNNLPTTNTDGDEIDVKQPTWYEDKGVLRHRHDILLQRHPRTRQPERLPSDFFDQRDSFLAEPPSEETATTLDSEVPIRSTVNVNGVDVPSAYFQPKEGNLSNLPLPVESSLEDVVHFWFQIAGESVPSDLIQSFREQLPNRPDLSSRELIQGLSMLSGSEEFSGAGKQALAQRITQLLVKAAQNPLVKEDLLDNCGLFSGTCHDGAAEALLHMENSAEVLQYLDNDGLIAGDKVPARLKSAIKQSILIEATRQHALEKMQQENQRRADRRAAGGHIYEPDVDFVEYNLSYLTALRNLGQIRIGPTEYRYHGEGRSWLDANTGVASIVRKSHKTEIIHDATKRLASRPGWQNAIEKLRPQTKESLTKIDQNFSDNDPFADLFNGDTDTLSRATFEEILPILKKGIAETRQQPDEDHEAFVNRVTGATEALEVLQQAFEDPTLPNSVKPDIVGATKLYAAYAWAKEAAKEQVIADATTAWLKS